MTLQVAVPDLDEVWLSQQHCLACQSFVCVAFSAVTVSSAALHHQRFTGKPCMRNNNTTPLGMIQEKNHGSPRLPLSLVCGAGSVLLDGAAVNDMAGTLSLRCREALRQQGGLGALAMAADCH